MFCYCYQFSFPNSLHEYTPRELFFMMFRSWIVLRHDISWWFILSLLDFILKWYLVKYCKNRANWYNGVRVSFKIGPSPHRGAPPILKTNTTAPNPLLAVKTYSRLKFFLQAQKKDPARREPAGRVSPCKFQRGLTRVPRRSILNPPSKGGPTRPEGDWPAKLTPGATPAADPE